MMRVILLTLWLVTPAGHALAASVGDPNMDIEGTWFSCEFAHSQIPPEDGCRMLDDDGFAISNGQISHVKVSNSRQRGCRHQRLGQCFLRDRINIIVSSSLIGQIRATAKGFAITYWGCTQAFSMQKRVGYFEVAPSGSHCLWTRDKRYFVARYQGRMQVEKD